MSESTDNATAQAEVTAAALNEVSESPNVGGGNMNLDMLLDVNVTLAIELGRAQINIRDLLKLNQGSVVDLDRMAGEPLDVLVNGTLVARGEIVVVKEKFGVMLTEVVSPEERVRRLN
ncbi:MAG TPA: flagellar motor switch protein FliN [Spongiibacteraceae bacterium]|nr:flagellar motor switch protein FliN [Spongiibacteraceae bacterium]HCS27716.1 flagellar motor switch protein FliN [Spongiibacteraceae bacterium]|tara:strand:+ start:1160 stop:1513 length:354 start_codon:yes stop_codon:yes gene_type:complete